MHIYIFHIYIYIYIQDQGTDARDVLEGKVYPLRHGYIGSCVSSSR